MELHYSNELAVQMLVALLKAHDIKKIVISPGATNVTFVASVQCDPFFELFSSVDERSAAYMACGLAAEGGEPVALSCTGATASRNYVPGLTEAFYRKLPVLAITSSQPFRRAGRGFPQMLDRTNPMNDIAKLSIMVTTPTNDEERWGIETDINEALLELRHNGGGPVHINVVTHFDRGFSVAKLPDVRKIDRHCARGDLPKFPAGKVAVFVGNHAPFTPELAEAVDRFCEAHNSAVLCDQTSNYRGKYRILGNLLANQDLYKSELFDVDVLVHIGEVTGAYMKVRPKEVWRVSLDGKLVDPFKRLRRVFEMSEEEFFSAYSRATGESAKGATAYFDLLATELEEVRAKVPDLPFSNAWCAQQLASMLPDGSMLHLGILNSLRSWNFFETPTGVDCYSNTGGFGIDGGVSSLLGACLARPSVLHFGVFGDLAFFYDMNSIFNRELLPTMRLMIVNNGRGMEFRNYNHSAQAFGEDADRFMAAAGHYGVKSPDLLRHYATDLGFEYMSASCKDELLTHAERFTSSEAYGKPIMLEVFTEVADESNALRMLNNLMTDGSLAAKGAARQAIKNVLGEKGIRAARKVLGR